MPKVRDAIRIVRRDGWYHVRTRGSHRVYHHPEKPGHVVIAGHSGKDMDEGTYRNVLLKQAGLKGNRMKYTVVIERGVANFSGYVPDLQCCVAADSRDETLGLIREGIAIYIETAVEFGEPVPPPRMSLADAMADYLSMDDGGYRDPDSGEWVKHDFQTMEVAFLMVEVDADSAAARVVGAAEPAVATGV